MICVIGVVWILGFKFDGVVEGGFSFMGVVCYVVGWFFWCEKLFKRYV